MLSAWSLLGITDAAMSTILASIVDDRYSANYSMIYTFSQTAVCLAYIVGPIASSIILTSIGTTGTVHVLGIIVILYGIICVSYRVYLMDGHYWSDVITTLAHHPYETLWPLEQLTNKNDHGCKSTWFSEWLIPHSRIKCSSLFPSSIQV